MSIYDEPSSSVEAFAAAGLGNRSKKVCRQQGQGCLLARCGRRILYVRTSQERMQEVWKQCTQSGLDDQLMAVDEEAEEVVVAGSLSLSVVVPATDVATKESKQIPQVPKTRRRRRCRDNIGVVVAAASSSIMTPGAGIHHLLASPSSSSSNLLCALEMKSLSNSTSSRSFCLSSIEYGCSPSFSLRKRRFSCSGESWGARRCW